MDGQKVGHLREGGRDGRWIDIIRKVWIVAKIKELGARLPGKLNTENTLMKKGNGASPK